MLPNPSQPNLNWESWENDGMQSYNTYYDLLGVDAPTEQTLAGRIAKILEALVDSNKDKQVDERFRTVFQADTIPGISIVKYMQRILFYSQCSPESYIYALIYMDRFNSCRENSFLNPYNVHKLLITSMTIATKFIDDKTYQNKEFAKIGGVKNRELNLLEVEFLETIGFNLWVEKCVFDEYLKNILGKKGHAKHEAEKKDTLGGSDHFLRVLVVD